MHHPDRPRTPAGRCWPVLVVTVLLALAAPVAAQNRAGAFDHYILALTWMPAFCRLDGAARADARCTDGRRAGWMVHGLWPQHRGGAWPEYCPTAHPAPSRAQTAAQAGLYGTSGAAWHQWNKHGRCTGLSAADYYDLTRAALERLVLPEVFDRIDRPLRVAPQVIEDAFAEANPGLSPEMMVTSCREGLLVELRLCLTRELEPRACDPGTRACRLPAAELLPLR